MVERSLNMKKENTKYSKYFKEEKKVEKPNIEEVVTEELIDDKTELEEQVLEETKIGTVNTELLNIRKEASKNSDVVCTVSKGEVIDILDEEGDFYKIEIGFVMKDYIEVK